MARPPCRCGWLGGDAWGAAGRCPCWSCLPCTTDPAHCRAGTPSHLNSFPSRPPHTLHPQSDLQGQGHGGDDGGREAEEPVPRGGGEGDGCGHRQRVKTRRLPQPVCACLPSSRPAADVLLLLLRRSLHCVELFQPTNPRAMCRPLDAMTPSQHPCCSSSPAET